MDKLEADLAKAMMSLPATKGFEIGEGFNCGRMRGSDHNDRFVKGNDGLLHSVTNHAGGTLGGISTGEPIIMRIAIKPASSISQDQETATFDGEPHTLSVKGRHDPCVLPRAAQQTRILLRAAVREQVLAELVRRRLIHRRCVGGHRGGPRDCVRSRFLGPIREVLPNFDDDFTHHAEQHGVRQRQRYHVPALHHRLDRKSVV